MGVYGIAFCSAALASLILTLCVRELARRLGWVDTPDQSRKLHSAPVPRIGGVAIYLSLWVALGVVRALGIHADVKLGSGDGRAVLILVLAGLMMLVGLWDDLKPLSPLVKFSAQTALAIAAWSLGFRILAGWSYTGTGTVVSYSLLSLPLTIIWIVGITNAFNLLDGLDGLSAGAALFATVSLVTVSFAGNNTTALLPLAALAGAVVGFLRYNFNPASIFLGDSGSLLLGFSLSLLSIEGGQKSPAAIAIGLPIVAFGLPIADTTLVVVRRFLSGKPLFKGDRRHIHHALMDRGLTPRTVVIVLYGVCAVFGFFSLWFLNPSGRSVALAMTILGVSVWIGIKQLHYPELREFNAHVARGTRNLRKLIAGSVSIGRLVDNVSEAGDFDKVLASLSSSLQELGFSAVEIRLPISCQPPVGTNWVASANTGTGSTLRWNARPRSRASDVPVAPAGTPQFKVEIPLPLAAAGLDLAAGSMVFYHTANHEFPVSAICLLSRNVWLDFETAFSRLVADAGGKASPNAAGHS